MLQIINPLYSYFSFASLLAQVIKKSQFLLVGRYFIISLVYMYIPAQDINVRITGSEAR